MSLGVNELRQLAPQMEEIKKIKRDGGRESGREVIGHESEQL